MATLRYTVEQLHTIRESPLVQRPNGLPDIGQWMEIPDVAGKKTRHLQNRSDDHGTAENGRSTLYGARHLTRGSGTGHDDIVLGPPKMNFASASTSRSKNATPSERSHFSPLPDDPPTGSRKDFRTFMRDREGDRQSEKSGVNGRRGLRDGSDWSNVRSRKSMGQEDGDTLHRTRDRDRHHKDNDQEGVDLGPRRNGYGRGRNEGSWTRHDDGERSEPKSSGWRDRKGRDDFEWSRGRHIEEDPEWMDTPAKSEKKQAHTQEDFERWKERMKANAQGITPAEEKEAPMEVVEVKPAKTSKPATPLEGDMFGLWQEKRKPSTDDVDIRAKAATGKPKSSKFATFFTPKDPIPAPVEETIESPQEMPNPLAGLFQTPKPRATDDKSEDKEGFQRILAMLGNQTLKHSPAQSMSHGNGGHPFAQSPSNETGQPDSPARQRSVHSQEARSSYAESQTGRIPSVEPKSLQGFLGGLPPGLEAQGDRVHGMPLDGKVFSHDREIEHAPNGSAQDRSQGTPGPNHQQAPSLNRDSAFLLNLMKQSTPTPPQTHGFNRPQSNEPSNFQGDAQKPRGPPPGFFNENQFGEPNFPPMQQQRREHEIPPEFLRASAPRAPPGFFDDPILSALQRRNGGDGGPRQQPSNMGIPQQPPPDSFFMKQGMPPPDHIAPPPGFGGQLRQPPGFGPGGPPNGMGGPNGPGMPGFPPGGGPNGPPGMGRGMGGPPPGFPSQMPPPGFFGLPGPGGPGGPNPPPGFPGPMMGGPMGGPPRGQFDMFGDMGPGRPMGRGGPPPGPGQFM